MNLKLLKPELESRLLLLLLGTLMSSLVTAEETMSMPQQLLQMEHQVPIEGKMTAVFTGDTVRVSIQGGPMEFSLGERSTRGSGDLGRALPLPAREVPKALGVSVLDNRHYDRFGRDPQDLSLEAKRIPFVGADSLWASTSSSYVHDDVFGLLPNLVASKPALPNPQIRQLRTAPKGSAVRMQVLPMQARIDR